MNITREYLGDLQKKLLADRKPGEHYYAAFAGEESQFIRINAAKVRQIGTVEDASIDITLLIEAPNGEIRRASRGCTLSGLSWKDWEELQDAFRILRSEVPQLPIDPYAKLPQNVGSSETQTRGELLNREEAPAKLLEPVRNMDIAGIYAAGPVVRAMFNSAGLFHWFGTETFSLDYSIYTASQRALKGTFAGQKWDGPAYVRTLEAAQSRLAHLEKPARKVPRGAYRTYIAPAGVHDLVGMLSWGGVSEAAVRQGDSPLRRMRTGERKMSPLFSLSEDFSEGVVPRFNDLGELAPERLPLITRGVLENTLVSSRTGKEYGVASNGAGAGEGLRSPVVANGDLKEEEVLARLGTGLYLSNLHYLNWSDQPGGRITGMTRYACFWVEEGKIVAPIENLRWDDSIFSLFGEKLEAVSAQRSLEPEVGTYFARQLGAALIPGILVSEMNFTL